MRKTFHQTIIFPSLCCLFFYTGNLLVGETEAKFSSQVRIEPIEISAAMVFPSTIKQLEGSAEEIVMRMKETYHSTLTAEPGGTLEELQVQLSQITAGIEELYIQMDKLHRIHEEMSVYQNNIQDHGQFEYVDPGFRTVDGLWNEVQASIDFSKLEAIRSMFHLKIIETQK
ncbi:hypothetical protein [Neobacillus niacini]|uniref:hypothetical protein n=1 Tax=Neobacillus niacini TaxID=86668 RepID=UPI003983AE21